jgi:VWFA-related protein
MRNLLIVGLLIACTPPAFAFRRVTVAQLSGIVEAEQTATDQKAAQQLATLELSERLSSAILVRLQVVLPGPESRQTLAILADQSAFLRLPAAQLDPRGVPSVTEQQEIMAKVVGYVTRMLPKLPDFFATRTTTTFENTPQTLNESVLVAYRPLHRLGSKDATVTYRNGTEAVAEKNQRDGPSAQGLRTWGVFGPILSTVLLDAARSQITWSYWEKNSNGGRAVFRYAVPAERSHYWVDYCCVTEQGAGSGAEPHPFRRTPGYHGEIAVDPAVGTVLRMTVEADLNPGDPVAEASIAVEYGPVELGGKTYFCPIKSISKSVAQTVQIASDYSYAVALQPEPLQTSINDARFDQYHLFQAELRILTGPEGANPTSAGKTAGPESGTAAAAQNYAPTAANEADGAITATTQSGASIAPGATTAPVEPRTSQPPEISVGPAAALPDAPLHAQPAAAEKGFVLRTTSRLVDVSVVARDKKGHPITDLKLDDFEVDDNGRKQTLKSLSRSATATEAAIPTSPGVFSNHAPPAGIPGDIQAAAAPQASSIVLLLDGSNLSFFDLTHARGEILRFLRALPPGQPVALYAMKSRSFEVLTVETTDYALLAKKLAAWMPDSQDLAQAQDEEKRNRQQVDWASSGDLAMMNGNSVTVTPGSELPGDPRIHQNNSNPRRDALLVLPMVARSLAALPGHKNLVWVTSDNVLADWSSSGPTVEKRSKLIDENTLNAQEAMNDAHVSVYPLDASQLEAGGIGADLRERNVVPLGATSKSPGLASLGDADPGMKPGRITAEMQQDIHPIQGTFRELADATGGHAFRRAGDLAAELKAVADDGRALYQLSFSPDLSADNKYHLLTVRVAGRKGIVLRYRTGYFYAAEPATMKERFQQAVWNSADATQISISVTPRHSPDGYELKLNIAARDLDLIHDGDFSSDKLDIFLVERDDAALSAKVTGQALGLRLSASTYQRVLRDGISIEQKKDSKPASGSLRVLVVDENSGRMGSVTLPVAALAVRN